MGDMAYGPYFDQEEPQAEIMGLIADLDISPPYELDAAAVFKIKKGFLVVFVSGCSCWPDRGTTTQVICNRIVDVDRELRGEWSALLNACQAKKWKPSALTTG
jgi:hypothetical protein